MEDVSNLRLQFKQSSINLFDYVFTNFLIPRFKVDKSNNPSIAYSNWLKTNTGFEGVIRDINASIFDAKQEQHLQAISKYFVSINTEQMNKNIDEYEDLIKKNAKIISKNSKGQELNAIDEDLRNKLMIYRLNYSLGKHIPERNVFTDKMLDRMVSEKPMNKEALLKIINPSTFSCCGEELLKIITEFI